MVSVDFPTPPLVALIAMIFLMEGTLSAVLALRNAGSVLSSLIFALALDVAWWC